MTHWRERIILVPKTEITARGCIKKRAESFFNDSRAIVILNIRFVCSIMNVIGAIKILSRSLAASFDDEIFQFYVFQNIVVPLRNLREFVLVV